MVAGCAGYILNRTVKTYLTIFYIQLLTADSSIFIVRNNYYFF